MTTLAEAWEAHVETSGVYSEEDGFRAGWEAHERAAGGHDDLIDQGVTRLQLLSFLRGEHSARWNGGDLKWVVYRRHQIDRECSPDATIIRLAYTGHQTGTNTAVIEAVPGSDVDAATALRVIDTIIDAAIAHHGPDGVA